jgi:hypothetical protein
MHIQFRNRGILVPFFLIICFIGVAILKVLIQFAFGEHSFVEGDMVLLSGVAFLVAGYWTHRKRDTFYIVDGETKRMNEQNTFFFLSMEMWAQIYWSFGTLCVLGGFISLMGLVEQ